MKKRGFTLSEIVVAITIFAVVTAVSANIISTEIAEKQIRATSIIFNNEVAVALADELSNNELSNLKDQTTFNEKFKKYFDFDLLESNAEIAKAFAETYTDENGKEFSPYKYISSDGKEIELKNRAITSKGVSIAYTYDTTCNPRYQFSQDASTSKNKGYDYIAKNEALSCIKGFYDINGAKGPNKIGEDVKFFTEFKKGCEGNYIPDEYGKCPSENESRFARKYCGLTDLNCQANGEYKTVDEKSCSCVCRLSCPHPLKLDEKTCTCSCNQDDVNSKLSQIGCIKDTNGNFTKAKGYHGDCMATVQTCTKMCDANAKAQCETERAPGVKGTWNPETCMCDCAAVEDHVNKNYYGFAKVDWGNYCEIQCKSESDIKKQGETNAKNKGLSGIRLEVSKLALDTSDVTNKCFTCKNEVNTTDGKRNTARGEGYCIAQCPQHENFDYFTYNNDPAACRYECNSTKLQEYANSLNNDYNKIRPRVDQAAASTAKLQEEWFTAAAIGKAQSELGSSRDANSNVTTWINGNNVNIYHYGRCTHCAGVYQYFWNEVSPFAGFWYNIQRNTAPYYTILSQASKDLDINMKYIANTSTCSIDFTGFNYDYFIPNLSYVIHYHSANVGSVGKWLGVQYGFNRILNRDTHDKISNPNHNIKYAPGWEGQGRLATQSWDDKTIGVRIAYRNEWYDPLAINIDDSHPNDNPRSTNGQVDFKLEYNSGDISNPNNYTAKKVYWPNENTYRFIVKRKSGDSSTQHVGNMFSDVFEYSNGFAQLRAENDSNKDGLVSRTDGEIDNLYLWKRSDNTYEDLKNKVFDIITNISNAIGAQNSSLRYNIQSQYRKLVPSKEPESNSTNLVYKSSKVENNIKEEIWEAKDGSAKYKFKPIGSAASNEYHINNPSSWKKIIDKGIESDMTTVPSFNFYYKSGNTWYKVEVAKIVDIVFIVD